MPLYFGIFVVGVRVWMCVGACRCRCNSEYVSGCKHVDVCVFGVRVFGARAHVCVAVAVHLSVRVYVVLPPLRVAILVQRSMDTRVR